MVEAFVFAKQLCWSDQMRVVCHEMKQHEAYIRHARVQTLKSLELEPHPALVEPLATAKYVIALSSDNQEIGLGESIFLNQVYESYAAAPYGDVCDLNRFCPIDQMAGMRTIFVEPEYRKKSSLFLSLTLGSAKLFHDLGARFATATTRASDVYLNRLYSKCSGERVGVFRPSSDAEPIALFVFNLTELLNRRLTRRISNYARFAFAG